MGQPEIQPAEPTPKGVAGDHLEKAHSVTEYVDLNTNLEAKIKNPLKGIPYEQLMHDVQEFAVEKGLEEHIALLRKGALVAQDPTNYRYITGPEALDEAEKKALEEEVTHRWRLPKRLFLTIATCSIGAAVQGWDQTGTNGANIFFPEIYGIGGNSARDRLILGVVNAGPYIGSAFLGCWLSDPINNWLGRRGVIFISAHFCIWPLFGSALSHNWQQQLVNRLLMGIGMGVKASTVPIYAAENAPASIRGALVMSWQMWTAFGIFLGTAFNLAVYNTGSNNWRYMLGAPFIPAVPLVVMIYFCPESPRWYMKKNKYPKAWESMNVLRNNPIQVARDIYYIHAQLNIERQLTQHSTYISRFTELFTIPRVRRANIAAFTVMIAQQMCGINIIAFYSTTIFKESGYTEFQAMLCSFGFGLVNWLFSFPAFWTIDTFGRRSLLLFTFPQMMWTLLAAGLCTLLPISTTRTALVALFVFLFAAFYSPGEGPVPFTYSAEVYPLSHREVGMGFAVATCLFWAAILGITFPFLLERAGTVGAFGCYAAFNAVAFIMIFFLVPETKQRTLEELDYVFAVPMKKFASYQLGTALPWWCRRWLLFQRDAVLTPFYHNDNEDEQEHQHQQQKQTSHHSSDIPFVHTSAYESKKLD
ncbi:and other transporter-domain-containing protein [Pseudomassariella vexata]|uniref:And other transporter-domain-containing protein n=1 Tax=Pseudomassariella vexata TaxID=1141098 RepID=A0A1Y2DF71_9PEZI|nr:and other transporter-domain-containing protein [Pseudomassariella vexata]ORY57315.1 and other transporter-domain-containing protein [Pseudomassariella vexata]